MNPANSMAFPQSARPAIDISIPTGPEPMLAASPPAVAVELPRPGGRLQFEAFVEIDLDGPLRRTARRSRFARRRAARPAFR